MSIPVDSLIAALAGDLRPVRRLHPPMLRAATWFAVVAGFGLLLAGVADLHSMRARLDAVPDLRLAMIGSLLTAILAAIAAFQASIPGRSRLWPLAAIPPACLWLGASGWGCLRAWGLPGLQPATAGDAVGCATFILLVSAPLSLLLAIMLRRACPLWPGRVAGLAGLAAAAAAATLLTLFHPHDASAVDLLVHLAAVLTVVAMTRRLAR